MSSNPFLRYFLMENRLKREANSIHENVIEQLDAIDTKAAALLAFNGLLLAALSIFASDKPLSLGDYGATGLTVLF